MAKDPRPPSRAAVWRDSHALMRDCARQHMQCLPTATLDVNNVGECRRRRVTTLPQLTLQANTAVEADARHKSRRLSVRVESPPPQRCPDDAPARQPQRGMPFVVVVVFFSVFSSLFLVTVRIDVNDVTIIYIPSLVFTLLLFL